MHKYQQKVLSLFRRKPNSQISTNEIVEAVEPQKLNKILDGIEFGSDLNQIKIWKRKKAALHRKILYHLNLLVNEGVLRVVKETNKGEKIFELNIRNGEELTIEKLKKRTIKIVKPSIPSMPIQSFEQGKVVHRYEPSTWVDRLNSVLVECSVIKDLKNLEKTGKELLNLVNDVVAFNDFSQLFRKYSVEEIIKFCTVLETEAEDFGKYINLLISNLSPDILQFLAVYAKQNFRNTYIIFDINTKLLQRNRINFEKIVGYFSPSGIPILIKNKDIINSPCILGSVGVFGFDENEWENYKQELKGKLCCLACSQTTLSIDIKKFYESFGLSTNQFDNFITKCAETLLSANTVQRRKTSEFFNYMAELNQPYAKETFFMGRNYIRFWNYDYLKEKFGEKFVPQFFKRVNELISEYCHSEETIYVSCGMPARFRIATSVLLKGKHSNDMSPLVYYPPEIMNFEDFYSDEIKDRLKEYENFVDSFSGGVFIEFIRKGDIKPEEVIREINIILSSYRLPFFIYHLKSKKPSDMKLSEFI